jgi:hypothetical protein
MSTSLVVIKIKLHHCNLNDFSKRCTPKYRTLSIKSPHVQRYCPGVVRPCSVPINFVESKQKFIVNAMRHRIIRSRQTQTVASGQFKHKLAGKRAFRVQGYCNSGRHGILSFPFHYDVISTECFPFVLMPHAQLEEPYAVYSTAIKYH